MVWQASRLPRRSPDLQPPPGRRQEPQALVSPVGMAKVTPEQEEVALRIHRMLLEEVDMHRLTRMSEEEARQAVVEAASALLSRHFPHIVGLAQDIVIQRVIDEMLGLGPLEQLMRDPSISEIMVNAPDEVYFEREGIIYRSNVRFQDHEHIMRVVQRILGPLGRRVDEASPMVDARLRDGSRVNVIIPPLAPKSPVVTIRRFRADKMTMEDLVAAGTITREVADFLGACVKARLNILISGGTGTGKTTLLNALSAYIPHRERIITIEDPIELKLQQPHVVSLEARPPSIEGKGEVTQRDLLRNALRMRPDRIIIGEVRGPEAFDMLNAMNTGHEGSLSTIHANSPRDALARLENMVLMAGFDLPQRAIREQIASALDLIVQVARFVDGVRRITQVTEVVGMEGNVVTLQDIFVFQQEGIDGQGRVVGQLRPTGIRPTFSHKLELAGIQLPAELFLEGAWT
jgi:pilus assembly protein CpaF